MVRAPCCEKMGLKKGPWTREEDQILINYINLYGHGNWRALPKQAGLLRCGKSCRLRWINYLRPDIKRGNFSPEEEDTIIKLHQVMGNRWSAIAARLPGRTDNEIKNVWHTHLKKRLKQQNQTTIMETKPDLHSIEMNKHDQLLKEREQEPMNYSNQVGLESPQRSASSEISSVTTTTSGDNTATTSMNHDAFENFPEVDDNFWSDVFSADDSSVVSGFPAVGGDPQAQFQFSPFYGYNSNTHDGMDYWFNNFFTTAGELVPDLPEF